MAAVTMIEVRTVSGIHHHQQRAQRPVRNSTYLRQIKNSGWQEAVEEETNQAKDRRHSLIRHGEVLLVGPAGEAGRARRRLA